MNKKEETGLCVTGGSACFVQEAIPERKNEIDKVIKHFYLFIATLSPEVCFHTDPKKHVYPLQIQIDVAQEVYIYNNL